MGDADDSYDFANLDAFVERLRAGADLVMGNRFKGGIAAGAMPPLHRYLGNPVLSFLGRLFFGIEAGDFHCGLRAFNTESIRRLDLQTSGMEFASEMVVRSALAGLRIEEVPTTLKPDGRSRPPHLRTWRDGWRHLKFLLMYNPRWLFFIPGAALCGLGALLALPLFLFGSLRLADHLTLDFNSFVAACFMVVCGVQLLTFGVLSRYYAAITGILPDTRGSAWLAAMGEHRSPGARCRHLLCRRRRLLRLRHAALGEPRLRPARPAGDPAHRRARPGADRDRAAAVLLGLPARYPRDPRAALEGPAGASERSRAPCGLSPVRV